MGGAADVRAGKVAAPKPYPAAGAWQPLPMSSYLLICFLSGFMVLWIGVVPGSPHALYSAKHAAVLEANPPPDFFPLGRNQTSKWTTQPVVHVLHTVPGFFWAAALPFQFHDGFRRSFPAVHRAIGRLTLFVTGIPIAAGVFYITQNKLGYGAWTGLLIVRLATWGVNIIAVWFVYAAVRAGLYAKARRFDRHQAWVLRHAAAGLLVTVLRIMCTFCGLLAPLRRYDLPHGVGEERKINDFALCELLSAVVMGVWAELLIRQLAAKRAAAAKATKAA